jgi:glutamate synthase domain-containing protein 2
MISQERIFGWLEEVLDGSARKIPILADGTVRTGFDVLKIRALGADVALIGRPLAQVCIGGGYVAVQPLNCHGCATKECEFTERQLELVFTRAPISAKEERLVDLSTDVAVTC